MEMKLPAVQANNTFNADDIIRVLGLSPHPEGGFYRETYRDAGVIKNAALPERFNGDRSYSTAIYYLLNQGAVSRLHKIASDEVWHHYQGESITVVMLNPDPTAAPKSQMVILGQDLFAGEVPQAVVPAGWWFGAFPNIDSTDASRAYALVGCTVAPGFDFADFVMAERDEMLAWYPGEAEQELIRRLLP